MTTQHTPGPWYVTDEMPVTTVLCGEPDDPEIVCILEDVDPMMICNRADGTDYELLASNARLIAAAPDLLAACESLMRSALVARNYIVNAPELRFTNENQLPAESLYFAIRDARSAIAKARGEQP